LSENILVISPSGDVHDHDCVCWYQSDRPQHWIDHYHNIGDAFVFDSALKLLDFAALDVLDIRDVTEAAIARYNGEFDYVFLRGSNYIHNEMDWENAEAALSRLKIPVIAFGVGAQAPATGRLELSPRHRRFWQMIGDLSVSLGVRGAYTAEVLRELGVKNVRVVGCPTAFRARSRSAHRSAAARSGAQCRFHSAARGLAHVFAGRASLRRPAP
jgi:rhodanese-related sulfurtransferase